MSSTADAQPLQLVFIRKRTVRAGDNVPIAGKQPLMLVHDMMKDTKPHRLKSHKPMSGYNTIKPLTQIALWCNFQSFLYDFHALNFKKLPL